MSGIDIAILAGQSLATERLFELQGELALRLRCNVDLVDLCSASTVVREYGDGDADLFDDPSKQDSMVLNIQRACEASIAVHAQQRLDSAIVRSIMKELPDLERFAALALKTSSGG